MTIQWTQTITQPNFTASRTYTGLVMLLCIRYSPWPWAKMHKPGISNCRLTRSRALPVWHLNFVANFSQASRQKNSSRPWTCLSKSRGRPLGPFWQGSLRHRIESNKKEDEIDRNYDQQNFPNGEVNTIIGGPQLGSRLSTQSTGIGPGPDLRGTKWWALKANGWGWTPSFPSLTRNLKGFRSRVRTYL